MITTNKLKNDLRKSVSDFRYEHSLLVADEAKKLAKYYHINEEEAYISGLKHDIAKDFTSSENSRIIEKYHLNPYWLLEENANILHAEIGAYFVKDVYDFHENICNSIRYHAIGNKTLTILEKIVFIADKISRKNITPAITEIKKTAYQNLDKALELCLLNQKRKLASEHKELHPVSLDLLNDLQKEKK